MKTAKLILSLVLFIVLGCITLKAQNLDSVRFKQTNPTTCDSLTIYVHVETTNSNQRIDSISRTDSLPLEITTYVSSSGIGTPTITSFKDSVVLANVSPNNDSLKGYLDDNNTLTDSTRRAVTIQKCTLSADFSLNKDSLCNNDTLQANDKSESSDSLRWYKDGIFKTTQTNPSFTFTDTGFHTIQQIAFDTVKNQDDTLTKQVYVVPDPPIAITPSNVCGGKQDTLSVKSGFSTYTWQVDGNALSSYSAKLIIDQSGNYTVKVADAYGCFTRDTVAAKALVDLGPDTSLCKGDTLVFDAGNPNASHKWQDNSTTQKFEATKSGSYHVAVSDGNCTGYDTVQATFNSKPSVDLGNDTSICEGDEITLDAGNSGASYEWQDNSRVQRLTVSQAGLYHVTVTGSKGCVNSDSITISLDSRPSVNLGNANGFCKGDSIVLDAGNPNAKHQWQDNSSSQTYTAKDSGFYKVAVTNQQNCTGSDSITLDEFDEPRVNLGPDTGLCPSDSLVLNAGSPTNRSYSWQDNSNGNTFIAKTTGQYHVKVTNTNGGCFSRDTIGIQGFNAPTVSLPDTFLCPSDSVRLDAGPNRNTYQWQNGDQTRFSWIANAGKVRVMVTNNKGCKDTGKSQVRQERLPQVDLGPDSTICQGDTILFNAGSGGTAYDWQDGAKGQFYEADTAGQYVVNVSNGFCSASDSVNLSVSQPLPVNLGNDTVLCEGSSLILRGPENAEAYTWQDQSTADSFLVKDSGIYHLRVKDGAKCISRDTIIIDTARNPRIDLGSDTTICEKSRISLSAGPSSYSYQWNTGFTGPEYQVDTTAGNYDLSVTATTAEGCTAMDSIRVTVDICGSVGDSPDHDLIIYPNPVHTTLNIEGKNSFQQAQRLTIINTKGEVAYEGLNFSFPASINVTDLPPGAYFLQINTELGSTREPIIILE